MGTPPKSPRRASHGQTGVQAAGNGAGVPIMSPANEGDPSGQVEETNTGNGGASSTVEEQAPPLPPRPPLLQATNHPSGPHSPGKAPLQSKATTALSSLDIHTLSFPDGSRGTFSVSSSRAGSEPGSGQFEGLKTLSRKASRNGSEIDDNASLRSYAPTLRANGDLASLIDDELHARSPAWRLLNAQAENAEFLEPVEYEDTSLVNFKYEFDEIPAVDSTRGNEGRPGVHRHGLYFNFF